MPNATEVTAGKPKVGGHVWRAPAGTTLPTDATTALADAFIDMGYISADGVKNANSRTTETIKAWGGTAVLQTVSDKEDNFSAKFISSLNPEVRKMVYGNSNVTGSAMATGYTIKANSTDLEECVYVFEMIMTGNIACRIVIPKGKPKEIGEVTYVDNDAVGYDVTLGCTADSSGNTHYEYLKTVS